MKRIVVLGSVLGALLGASLLAGCASTVFEARADRAGDFFKHGEVTPTDVTPRLYVENAPDDFNLGTDGVVRFDKSKYEYLGKIYVRRNFDNWRLGYVSFNETWRRFYCPPIMTLMYGTGFILGATPLPYFCFYETSNSASRLEERKKNLAYAAIERGMWIGATHIIYATYTGIEYPQGAGQTRQIENGGAVTAIASESQHPYMGMVAHAFKKK
jgi:hypothetical protein